MGYMLYIITVFLVITWAFGFTGFSTGGITHVLLVIAVIAFIIKFFLDEKIFSFNKN